LIDDRSRDTPSLTPEQSARWAFIVEDCEKWFDSDSVEDAMFVNFLRSYTRHIAITDQTKSSLAQFY
jgi:hypothetical protein